MSDINDLFSGDQFPDRPDHADFWRLSSIVLKLDGGVSDPQVVGGGVDLFDRLKEVITSDESAIYMCNQRTSMFLNALRKADPRWAAGVALLGPHIGAAMASMWLEGFVVGNHFKECPK